MSGRIYRDIEYGRVNASRLVLDAFVPEGEEVHPIVILVHGGGWVGGDKQDMEFLCEPLSEAGFTCFSVNYRLAPARRWPACLDDVRRAIQWVKAHAADYRGNPDKIVLVGYSAGGHLVCMAAVHEPVNAVIGLAAPTDHPADSARRGGLSECMQKLLDRGKKIDEAGLDLLKEISPINHVRSDLPPYLLIHGTADQSVPYEQSVHFQAKLKASGVPCELIPIEGAPHRISDWEQFGVDYKPQMADWLRRTLEKRPSQTAITDKNQRVFRVCADGTGDFMSVQAAVDAVPEGNQTPTVILIRPGRYKEKIVVPRSKRFITFRGEDAKTTVLTYALFAHMKDENGEPLGTFRTPSVTIEADDFSAEHITFENSAGAVGQAVAVTVIGDRVVFRNCRFLGWQDTLLDQTGRHYYKNCTIAGHCDFIFGGGTAFFENCRIHCLEGSYITAASTPQHQPYGYVFSNCTITGEPAGSKTYLGRPWRDYAYVVFLNTKMSEVVRPEGWHNWGRPHREKTVRYGEYNSTGPGAAPEKRVDWARQLTETEAQRLTISNVLAGKDGWNPLGGTVQKSLDIRPGRHSDAERFKKKAVEDTADGSGYLFTAVRSKGGDGLFLSFSENGLDWNKPAGPFLKSPENVPHRIRNPYLTGGPNGTFGLVWQTDATGPCGIGYARSKDLIHWTGGKFIELMSEQNAFDVVEPALFYDTSAGNFILTWASTLPGNYYQAYQEDVQNNPRLWFTTTADFETFAPERPFFEPGYSVQQGVIVRHDSDYALIHEDSRNMMKTVRVSFAESPTGAWGVSTDALPLKNCQHPAVLPVGDMYLVFCESGGESEHRSLLTQDFTTWVDISAFVSFPAGYDYGNVLKISPAVVKRLTELQS